MQLRHLWALSDKWTATYIHSRFDTSAYSGEGIEEAVRALVEKILTYPDIFFRKREKHAVFKPEYHNDFTNGGCC